MAVENISGSDIITTEFARNTSKASESVEKDTREIVERPAVQQEETKGNYIDKKA